VGILLPFPSEGDYDQERKKHSRPMVEADVDGRLVGFQSSQVDNVLARQLNDVRTSAKLLKI
jgi:hypothetical protein